MSEYQHSNGYMHLGGYDHINLSQQAIKAKCNLARFVNQLWDALMIVLILLFTMVNELCITMKTNFIICSSMLTLVIYFNASFSF